MADVPTTNMQRPTVGGPGEVNLSGVITQLNFLSQGQQKIIGDLNSIVTALQGFSVVSGYTASLWTPAITAATPGDLAVTYSTRVGKRVKIGNLVWASFSITTSAFTWTTSSGDFQITGLLDVPATASLAPGTLTFGGLTKATYTQFTAEPLTTSIIQIVANKTAGAPVVCAIGDFPTGGTVILRGSVMYEI